MVFEMNHQNSTWNMPDVFHRYRHYYYSTKRAFFFFIHWNCLAIFPMSNCPLLYHTQMFFFTIFCVTDDVFPTYIYLSSIIYLWNILYIWHQMWLCSQALLDQSEFSRMYLHKYQDMYLYPTHTVCLDDYLGLWNELGT